MKCWWLRVFWSAVAFSVFLAGGAAAAPVPPACNRILDNTPFVDWKDCTPQSDLGNTATFIRLDFSKVDENDINILFGKAPSQLVAGIKIVGNEKLQTLNFGNIEQWGARSMNIDALFIEIVNNPYLEKIVWKMTNIDPEKSFQVLVYNNPKLNLTDATVDLMMNKANPAISYIERELGVCTFENPKDRTKYEQPTKEFLSSCEVVKGDLDLEKMTLPKTPVKLYSNKGGCLRLVKVDTSQGQIIYSPKNGSMTCGHGSLSSEFKNNLNLCGQKVVDLEGAPQKLHHFL